MMLRRTGGRAALAEELTHDTWVAVWDSLRNGRYDPSKAAISTFMYAVAHKLWLQHLRRAGQAHASLNALDSLLDDAAGSDHPAALLHAEEMVRAIQGCLHAADTPFSLTDEERQVVIGLAGEETERTLAGKLGVAASTIHARKVSAYKKLRSCMTAKGFGEAAAERPESPGE